MPQNTYVALDQVTLESNGGPVTFSNIPQTYTDLRIVISGGFTNSGYLIGFRVGNGSVDTSSNYSYVTGRGPTTSAMRKNNMTFGGLLSQGSNTLNNVVIVDLMNYSSTSTNKTWLSRYGSSSIHAEMVNGLWRSNSAINIISIAECGDGGSGTFNTGNLLAGSTFTLYGIKAWVSEGTTKATGGYVYEDSTHYYHAFLSSGTFTPLQSLTADILVVAGGGGGGYFHGGGGAGGLLAFSSQSLSATNYTCTVGSGGAGDINTVGAASDGSSSQFGALTATVGGGGGGSFANDGNNDGRAGGSGGGGGGADDGGAIGTGGANTSGQGFAGGNGTKRSTYHAGGGGGGAGGAGQTSPDADTPGNGGIGATSSFIQAIGVACNLGQNVGGTYYFAGGGGGGANSATTRGVLKNGGAGGGGGGGYGTTNTNGESGLGNTGGGAGGNARDDGNTTQKSRGGSGIIVIRYAK
jgi:hypothetical protein